MFFFCLQELCNTSVETTNGGEFGTVTSDDHLYNLSLAQTADEADHNTDNEPLSSMQQRFVGNPSMRTESDKDSEWDPATDSSGSDTPSSYES